MLVGKRFVIVGLSRLTTRVAHALTARGASVAIVRGSDGDDLIGLLGEGVHVVTASGSRGDALREAGLAEAACLLALGDEDLANLQAAVTACEIAPDVPVVLRAFDPTLADQLEQGLNVRRAYSVSALSAPGFVAAALDEEVLETLRLGDAEVPICRLAVRPGSPVAGKTAPELKREFHCAVIAQAGPDEQWRPAAGDTARVAEGEQLLIGGVMRHVLHLARLNSRLFDASRSRAQAPRRRPPPRRALGVTLLPKFALALGLVLVLAVVVFAFALDLSPVDAVYFVVTTATTTGYGDYSLKDTPAWVKLFGCLVMLSGGALLAVIFSQLAAVATAERLEEQMGRRAQRQSGHIVVAGLGNVGYRVARLLSDLEIASVVVELQPDARFVEAVRQRAAVLSGDIRLPENLERAAIRDAVALIACTNDDLANIQACLHSRRLNPQVRTVARVFDDQLAEQITAAYQIDVAFSATRLAVSAFVGAATDELALRVFRVGETDFIAFRHSIVETISWETIQTWRSAGIRILALRRGNGPIQPPSDLAGALDPGDTAILAGPEQTIRSLLLDGPQSD